MNLESHGSLTVITKMWSRDPVCTRSYSICSHEIVNFHKMSSKVAYRPHGSGKLHQLLENLTCTPMSTVYPIQIRPAFVFCHDEG